MISYQPGDVLAFYGTDLVSRVIEYATFGPSHVGIIAYHNGSPTLFESTTLCPIPCLVTGKQTDGVQAHYPADRIANYPGRVERLELTPVWRMSSQQADELHQILMHLIGTPYSMNLAILSGTRLLKWSRFLPYADDASVFCSEMVAAVLMRLGRLCVSNPEKFNPANLVRSLRWSGVYGKPEVVR